MHKVIYEVGSIRNEAELAKFLNDMSERGFGLGHIVTHSTHMTVVVSKLVSRTQRVEVSGYSFNIFEDGTSYLTHDDSTEPSSMIVDMDPAWSKEVLDEITDVLVRAHDKYS